MQLNYGLTSVCDQNCGAQRADRQTHRQTHAQLDRNTDRQVKIEGPKILSNDFFFFKTDDWRSNYVTVMSQC